MFMILKGKMTIKLRGLKKKRHGISDKEFAAQAQQTRGSIQQHFEDVLENIKNILTQMRIYVPLPGMSPQLSCPTGTMVQSFLVQWYL